MKRALLWLGGIMAVLTGVFSALAIDTIELNFGHVEGNGWHAEEVVAELSPGARPAVMLAVRELSLPPPLDIVHGFRLRCPETVFEAGQVTCRDGTLRLDTPLIETPDARASFRFEPLTRNLAWTVSDVDFAAGRVELVGEFTDSRWQLDIRAHKLDVEQVVARLRGWLPTPKEVDLSGRANLSVEIKGALEPTSVVLETSLEDFSFVDDRGLREGANLALQCRGESDHDQRDWAIRAACDVNRGQVYIDPHYVEVGESPIQLAARGKWAPADRRLQLDRVRYRHPGVLKLAGRAVVSGEDGFVPQELDVELSEASLDGLYPVYLQPLVLDGLLELESAGQLAGRLRWRRNGGVQASLELQDVYVDDLQGRLGVYGLSGTVFWSQGAAAEVTRLRWSGGHVYRLQLGEAELEAVAEADHVRLTRPTKVPVLDGLLHIDALSVDGLGTSDLSWRFQGLLSPLTMESLSQALDWPPFGGSLSGVVPTVSYRNGRVSIEGALLVRAFDGEIVIHNLFLERPFGLVPKLEAEVDIRGLSLEPLTRAFSFGNIQGRLDGEVRGLRLENWQPAAFDARFFTPSGDKSRRRISQRAVDSLASIGGASGALSRTFTRFFKEFSYKLLGLSCRLQNGVCEMDGVAPAEQGYYIVKGGGIPRIDVVGYNRRVDWNVLLHRLKYATNTSGAVVQ